MSRRPVHARAHERRQVLRAAVPGGRRRWTAARSGEVVASAQPPSFAVGDNVLHGLRLARVRARRRQHVAKVDPTRSPRSAPTSACSGMPGLTAYAGLLDIGRVQGQATPSSSPARRARSAPIVGQIAKLQGRQPGHRLGRLRREGRVPDARTSASTPRSTTRTGPVAEQLRRSRARRHRRLLRQRRRRAPRSRARVDEPCTAASPCAA